LRKRRDRDVEVWKCGMHEDAQRTFQDLSACLEPLRWVYQNSMLGPRNLSHLPVSLHSLSSFKNRSIFSQARQVKLVGYPDARTC
jgi:hypothetical protein